MSGAGLHLSVRLLGYWLCATGRGTGLLHDAAAVRDDDGLPFVPGRHLRGLLRDAVTRLPAGLAAGMADGPAIPPAMLTDLLFGAAADDAQREQMPEGRYFGGLLQVASAVLGPEARQAALALTPELRRQALYTTQQATAIDRASGAALDHSLRSYEVAVPMPLVAGLTADPAALAAYERAGGMAAQVARDWPAWIVHALPLVRAVGAQRNRGLGRCLITPLEGASPGRAP